MGQCTQRDWTSQSSLREQADLIDGHHLSHKCNQPLQMKCWNNASIYMYVSLIDVAQNDTISKTNKFHQKLLLVLKLTFFFWRTSTYLSNKHQITSLISVESSWSHRMGMLAMVETLSHLSKITSLKKKTALNSTKKMTRFWTGQRFLLNWYHFT